MDLHRIHGGGGGGISDTPSRCTLKEPGEALYWMGRLAQVLFFQTVSKLYLKENKQFSYRIFACARLLKTTPK